MGAFKNLLGTVLDRFQYGIGGPMHKRDGGEISARNATDTDYAALRMALARVFGDSIELNAGAGGSGDDWTMKLSRPDSGMTTDIEIVMPTGTPSPGQGLRVASYSGGVVALEYYTASAGASNMVLLDETDIGFGESSPVALLTKPANALVDRVKVVVDTPFDGAPSISVGVAGSTSKYGAASHIDLAAAAGTVFELDSGVPASGATEDIIATYSAGGASAGAARVQIYYAIPS